MLGENIETKRYQIQGVLQNDNMCILMVGLLCIFYISIKSIQQFSIQSLSLELEASTQMALALLNLARMAYAFAELFILADLPIS